MQAHEIEHSLQLSQSVPITKSGKAEPRQSGLPRDSNEARVR